jgi:hypothetical protein
VRPIDLKLNRSAPSANGFSLPADLRNRRVTTPRRQQAHSLKRQEMNLKQMQDLAPWDWPPDARATILRTLREVHAEPNDRLLAAEMAGDSTVINDEAAAALLSVVGDRCEPEPLRAKAVIALGPALELAGDDEAAGELSFGDSPISRNTFLKINKSLRDLYLDNNTPNYVRRRILEASVRAPQNWHAAAVRSVYASDDEDWKLTAVFCMQWIKGFESEIVEALESANPDIHYEAVCAAGNWQVDAAWPHVAELVTTRDTRKPLLLAAINAVAGIRPEEARAHLGRLMDARDEDISEAAYEAILMAEGAEKIEHEFDEDADYDDLFDDEEEDDQDEGGLVH